jgi:hypothetical protein
MRSSQDEGIATSQPGLRQTSPAAFQQLSPSHFLPLPSFKQCDNMAVPFGISIGDFIAVGRLAYQIAQALSETRGAVSDYSSLIEMLKSLSGSLQTVSEFISGPSTESMVKPDKALINGINYHVQCCQRLLCQFTVNIYVL